MKDLTNYLVDRFSSTERTKLSESTHLKEARVKEWLEGMTDQMIDKLGLDSEKDYTTVFDWISRNATLKDKLEDLVDKYQKEIGAK